MLHFGSNAINLNTSFELKLRENKDNFNGLSEKLSLIKNLNMSMIQMKEIKKNHAQDLNHNSHKSPHDANNGQNKELHVYIKVFLVFCCIATGLYIIKVVCQCFKLKSKCNFDSTSGKNKNKITETCSQMSNEINSNIIIEEM